ncbi:MAG TPA: Tad domain-containing protein [Nocardioidaceae bacterium]|nr:Tad domain-containing protein [Nocardioidaceae bacterium]
MSRWSHDRERGSITPFVIIVAVALLFLAALVIDGSRQLSARARAVAYAEEAARAGAQKINLEEGFVQLLQDDAYAAVDEYCGAAMANDDSITSCAASDIIENTDNGQIASLTVEVEVEYDPIMLDMFTGSSGTLVTGDATAHPIEGIVEPEFGEFTPPPPIVDTHPVDPGIPQGTTGGTINVPSPPPSCRPPGQPPPPQDDICPDGPGPEDPGGPHDPPTNTDPTNTNPTETDDPGPGGPGGPGGHGGDGD